MDFERESDGWWILTLGVLWAQNSWLRDFVVSRTIADDRGLD